MLLYRGSLKKVFGERKFLTGSSRAELLDRNQDTRTNEKHSEGEVMMGSRLTRIISFSSYHSYEPISGVLRRSAATQLATPPNFEHPNDSCGKIHAGQLGERPSYFQRLRDLYKVRRWLTLLKTD